MRFYELLSGQTKPLTYSIEELRKMLCLEKKFQPIPNLEKKVIDIAQRELDESSPYSFTWERQEVSSRGRNGKKVVGYTFYPKFIQKNKSFYISNRLKFLFK